MSAACGGSRCHPARERAIASQNTAGLTIRVVRVVRGLLPNRRFQGDWPVGSSMQVHGIPEPRHRNDRVGSAMHVHGVPDRGMPNATSARPCTCMAFAKGRRGAEGRVRWLDCDDACGSGFRRGGCHPGSPNPGPTGELRSTRNPPCPGRVRWAAGFAPDCRAQVRAASPTTRAPAPARPSPNWRS